MTRTERQLLAVENWRTSGGRNSIVAATGVGKTRIALMTIDRILKIKPETVIRIIVPTKVLKDQWEAQLKDKEGERGKRRRGGRRGNNYVKGYKHFFLK